MKVLITGCAGFIGSNLASHLLSQGTEVVGIDNFDPYYDPAIKRSNIASLEGMEGFEFREGDIRDKELLDDIMSSGIDMVVHLAAKAGVRASFRDPAGYAGTNIVGTLTLLESARESDIRKVVFASSSSVYGDTSSVPYREDEKNTQPISPYGMTKFHGEAYCRMYSEVYGMDINAMRFFTVYGPGQRPDMAIHQFIRKIMAGETITLYGDGSTYRDYTHIDDIVSGIEGSMKVSGGFRIYNLGSGRPVKLIEMVNTISSAVGREAKVEYAPIPRGDMLRTYADISKARDELGYSPKVSFEEGVSSEVEWIRSLMDRGVIR